MPIVYFSVCFVLLFIIFFFLCFMRSFQHAREEEYIKNSKPCVMLVPLIFSLCIEIEPWMLKLIKLRIFLIQI